MQHPSTLPYFSFSAPGHFFLHLVLFFSETLPYFSSSSPYYFCLLYNGSYFASSHLALLFFCTCKLNYSTTPCPNFLLHLVLLFHCTCPSFHILHMTLVLLSSPTPWPTFLNAPCLTFLLQTDLSWTFLLVLGSLLYNWGHWKQTAYLFSVPYHYI